MSDSKMLLQAVELIYGSARAPDAWPRALQAVADLTGGGHAVLVATGSDDAYKPLLVSARVDERDMATSLAAHQALGAGVSGLYVPPAGTAVTRRAIIPDDEYERSDYYNEVVRPLDGFNALHLRQTWPQNDWTIAVCRGRRLPDFEESAIATLQSLGPHLQTALEFHRRLRGMQTQSASLAHALDHVTDGVILTDGAGRILHVNSRAARIAADMDGLILSDTGLAAASSEATQNLHEAIAALAAPTADIAMPRNGAPVSGIVVRLMIARPSGRLPLLLTLLPMELMDIAIPGTGAPRVAIFIDEPNAGGAIDRDAVADIFRLTAREADIAVLLAEGAEVAAIARRLGIGAGTVRFHLKNVFAKTDTHSQVALAALVRRFAKRWD